MDENFIPLKGDSEFKNKTKISDIEKDLNEITLYEKKDLSNQNKFIEINLDDVLDSKCENHLEILIQLILYYLMIQKED